MARDINQPPLWDRLKWAINPPAETPAERAAEEHYRELDRQSGRNEVATHLTDKLAVLAGDIRSQWEHYLATDPHHSAEINVAYKGQLSVYNDLALAVHELDNEGKINVSYLPEILDPESVSRGVHAAVSVQELQTTAHSLRQSIAELVPSSSAVSHELSQEKRIENGYGMGW